MTKKEKSFVNDMIYSYLLLIISDSREAGEVADALQDEVATDIEETADPDKWNSDDVKISLARVLRERILKTS